MKKKMNEWTLAGMARIPLLEKFLRENPNPSAKTVKGMDIKLVVADKKWQELRDSLVGTWKKTPDENIKKLKKYGGELTDPLKVRRLLNYLTGSAFRIGIVNNKEIESFRNDVRSNWEKMLKKNQK